MTARVPFVTHHGPVDYGRWKLVAMAIWIASEGEVAVGNQTNEL